MTRKRRPHQTARRTRPAFTLVELVVSVGVIVILVGITVPAVQRMTADNSRAELENAMTGLLRSARMQALNNAERGLFFYLDNDVQKCVIIEAHPRERNDGDTSVQPVFYSASEAAYADRFRILPDTITTISPPFRVAPLDIIQLEDPNDPDSFLWDDEEVRTTVSEMFDPDGTEDYVVDRDGAQNHRNFFTMLFSKDGRLQVGRDVYIEDQWPNSIAFGFADVEAGIVTGLPLAQVSVKQLQDTPAMPDHDAPIDPADPSGGEVTRLVVADDGSNRVALNFPSVAGALLYDESIFAEIPVNEDTGSFFDEQRRDIFIRTGRPLYVVPQTGAVITGPLGENETPEP